MTVSPQITTETDRDSLRVIAEIAYQECGLRLSEEKSSMIQSRLRRRLHLLGLPNFHSYCSLLQSGNGSTERKFLVSALTTNVSHFFREMHHFTMLRQVIKQRATDLGQGARFRVWSAGCAKGQEVYSAAMMILDVLPDAADMNIRILGTDIDAEVLQQARAGIFTERLMQGVAPQHRRRFFTRKKTGASDEYEAIPALKALVQINELNLLAPWPFRKPVDVIFCRNVLIYFDHATKTQLWPRFASILAQDGLLFLGHSEHISTPERYGLRCLGKTTYEQATKPEHCGAGNRKGTQKYT